MTNWSDWSKMPNTPTDLMAIDVKTGKRRNLTKGTPASYNMVAISPDGRYVACIRTTLGAPDEGPHPGRVAGLPGRVSEVELGQVARQVLDRDVMVSAIE